MELLQHLKLDAIDVFKRAILGNNKTIQQNHDRIIAVDETNQVILEILASGAGGKQFYEALGISSLMVVNTSSMDVQRIRTQLGLNRQPQEQSTRFIDVFLIIPSSLIIAKLISQAIRPYLNSRWKWNILWLPKATPECTLEMEKQGMIGLIEQQSLPIGLLPIDRQVAAMCHDHVFADLYVHRQQRALTTVVQSILKIEKYSSTIPRITCFGEFATRVRHMLNKAHSIHRPSATTVYFDQLILIDRMEDPLSMLLTPMTYEGLLDSLLGMNHGIVTYEKATVVDKEIGEISDTVQGKVKIVLNHMDELFEEIRDVNINDLLSNRLGEIAQELVQEVRPNSSKTNIHKDENTGKTSSASNTAANLAEITALLKKVPQLVKKKRSLANHLMLVNAIQQQSQNAALQRCVEMEMLILSTGLQRKLRGPLRTPSTSAAVKDMDRFLEEVLLRDPPLLDLYSILKLLCLLSLVSGGIPTDKLQWYHTQLCHTYGYTVLPLLLQLESLELLSATNKFEYVKRRRELLLLNDVVEEDQSQTRSSRSSSVNGQARLKDIDFMFPYTGYAPMSVRLVQQALGMKLKNSSNKEGNSAPISNDRTVENIGGEATSLFGGVQNQPLSATSRSSSTRRVLVYYIGGITVAEIAAYRWLNEMQSVYEFCIATTAICNGNQLLRAI